LNALTRLREKRGSCAAAPADHRRQRRPRWWWARDREDAFQVVRCAGPLPRTKTTGHIGPQARTASLTTAWLVPFPGQRKARAPRRSCSSWKVSATRMCRWPPSWRTKDIGNGSVHPGEASGTPLLR